MQADIINGTRIPSVKLGYMRDGAVVSIQSDEVFSNKKTVVLGIPGAFTPVCSTQHIPDFIANAPALRAGGFDQMLCIAPNDPFVLDAWRKQVDPGNQIRFLSDGNLDFCTGLGLSMTRTDFFLGHRSSRYMLIVRDCIIERVRVEADILNYACTRAEEVLIAA